MANNPPSFPTEDQIREAKDRLRARLLSVAVEALDPITEIEIQWHSISGVKYQFCYTDDLGQNWTLLPTMYDGDGTLKSVVFPIDKTVPQRDYKLLEHVPKGFGAIAAWDGSYVLLERVPLEPGHKHRLYRDNQLIADVLSDTLSFKDNATASGSRYAYSAEAYGS